MASSPLRPGSSKDDQLEYYKTQYEQLEIDLADFQASSKDLEEQLERDIEAAEKKERKLKEQVEKLGFEVEEWKTKHRQAKVEANNAQNSLQKEITSSREQSRSLQLKLRDIEVANDDYERQARNTTSSLEDLDSKLNVAIERGVLLEEELKNSDVEREALRIENQRLRDELGDLRVESEITLEKLRLSHKTIETLRARKTGNLALRSLRDASPASDASARTPLSPTMSTPPARSERTSDVPTPPSPPLSDEVTAPAGGFKDKKQPATARRTSISRDLTTAATPRPSAYSRSNIVSRHSRGPSLASNATSNATMSFRQANGTRPDRVSTTTASPTSERLPRSESLHQVKSLRLRMQKIEERVQSARSKLPAPRDTTPRASPVQIPSSVTVRKSSKRESTAATGASAEVRDTETGGDHRRSQSHVKRLSFGISRPASRSAAADRPSSRASAYDRPPSAASRPASRLSMAGTDVRPSSRASTHGLASRPQSSMSAQSSPNKRTHRPSASVSGLRQRAEGDESPSKAYGTSRRTTLDKSSSGLPAPSGIARRQSNGVLSKGTNVPASNDGLMRPPLLTQRASNVGLHSQADDDDDIGETY